MDKNTFPIIAVDGTSLVVHEDGGKFEFQIQEGHDWGNETLKLHSKDSLLNIGCSILRLYWIHATKAECDTFARDVMARLPTLEEPDR